ncbi:MAG: chemotaxis protein CheW [Proteobacteria bacterium]|nr:chemotaxis protein CheW [Pseudomonadota bacterium]
MTQASTNSAKGPERPRQMLTFRLGDELFAVDILRVQEIRGWSEVTRIPRSPPHLLGVLNLRGSIVPIVDMRLRFGLSRAEFTPLTVIIVLSVTSEAGTRELGMVVDGVSDVVDMAPDALRELPTLGNRTSTELIAGLASIENRMVILLDVNELMAMEQSTPVAVAATAAA